MKVKAYKAYTARSGKNELTLAVDDIIVVEEKTSIGKSVVINMARCLSVLFSVRMC